MKQEASRPKQAQDQRPAGRGPVWLLVFSLVYTVVVLTVDTLAVHHVNTPIAWRVFSWHRGNGTDLFKLVFWLAIPFALSLRRFDWGWLGVARWKRLDAIVLGVLVLACAGAVLVIPLFPSLRNTYGSLAHVSAAAKWSYATHQVIWTLSWLTGWEFLHRYFLLRPLSARWPRWGWVLVPVFEGVYHLQKPMLEALAMVAFSAILTPWALRRKNLLLPFLAHLAIEIELILFLVLL